MYRQTILILLLSFLSALAIDTKAKDRVLATEKCLQELDEVILHRQVFDAMKRQRIEELVKLQSQQGTLQEKISFNAMLYNECYVFDSDLAMKVVRETLDLAKQLNNYNLVAEWTIKESFILSATGLLKESLDALSALDISNLPNSIKISYYSQMTYLYSHFGHYSGVGELQKHYNELEQIYNDSIQQIITPDDPQFLWHDVWYRIKSGYSENTREQLRYKVELSSLDSREDAMASYALASIYRGMDQRDMVIKYLAMSGIADIRCSNKDIASLQELAEILLEMGDITRAYSYMNVCLHTSQEYHNRVRAVSVSLAHEKILSKLMDRDAEQAKSIKFANRLLTALIILLVIAIVWIAAMLMRLYRGGKKMESMNSLLERSHNDLETANQSLKDANESLKSMNGKMQVANQQLKESNLVKEEYVGYVFAICSNYISKLEEYRKDINRKAKAKMLPEILAMTEKQTMVQDELKEFYQNFDAIFLHLYPNFINDFNNLLAPEERIEPRKGELLNTDLRIYALVRLGITDSVKISEFLHCSPQTVYNNRLKVRNKAIVPKEHFVEAIRNLGCATD